MADTFLNLKTVAHALGGVISGGQVLAPGPNHSTADRSLSIKLDSNAPDGFVVHSFATNDPITCRDYVRSRLGLPAFKANSIRRRTPDKIEKALQAAVAQPSASKPKRKNYRAIRLPR